MAGELFFVIRCGGVLDRIQRVEVAEATIGRAADNVLCLPDSAVSRNHAVVVRTPTDFVIRDLGSRNGTRLNEQSIVEAVLPATAIVEIGPYQLRIFSDLDSAQDDAEGAVESTRKQPIRVRTNFDRERRERQLTPAQRRVYDELLSGRTEKEVAHVLKISINTVHSHSRAIYTKFRVSSRAELLSLCAGRLTQQR